MSIEGKKREGNFTEIPKYVGLTEVRVIAVNPSAEEFEVMMGYPPKEDSKQFEYLGESKDGNTVLRVDFWLEEIKIRNIQILEEGEWKDKPVNMKFKVTFFLEDKERENKDNTRKQYINNVGVCSWADDPNELADWFKARENRVAYVGEEGLYNFMRMWLYKLDYRSSETTLDLEWKKLMRGNVKDIRDQINGEWCDNIVALATIQVVDKDGKTNEYQRVYNDAFLSPYNLKFFRNVDYSLPEEVEKLKAKKPRDLKPHEKFVLNVTNVEYGCKDFYILKDIELYDSSKNIVASEKVISPEGADY